MLTDYTIDKGGVMDVPVVATRLYYYTSGYPFLVSRFCKMIDDEIMPEKNTCFWEESDVDRAFRAALQEKTTNSDSLFKNLENNEDLYNYVYDLIIKGEEKVFNIHNPIIELGLIHGIFRKDERGLVRIHNKFYEQLIYNYLSSKLPASVSIGGYNFRDQFTDREGYLNFEEILLKFQEFMKIEYSDKDEKFLERNGRLIFLAFLKPIINGKGYDFKEVQTSIEERLDVVITYLDRRYVVELKIWHGPKAHRKGLEQLKGYLDRINAQTGYLVIFDPRKTPEKKWQKEHQMIEGKEIFMVWV